MKNLKLDEEEAQILAAYERGQLRPARNQRAEIAKLGLYARNTFQKNKRVNIQLAERDLLGIQTRAMEEGVPYQALISSVLHKYLTGRLVERRAA